jgi:hypothetical protein
LVESTITGTAAVAGAARYCFSSSRPSIPGITRSCKITVGRSCVASATACFGSAQ